MAGQTVNSGKLEATAVLEASGSVGGEHETQVTRDGGWTLRAGSWFFRRDERTSRTANTRKDVRTRWRIHWVIVGVAVPAMLAGFCTDTDLGEETEHPAELVQPRNGGAEPLIPTDMPTRKMHAGGLQEESRGQTEATAAPRGGRTSPPARADTPPERAAPTAPRTTIDEDIEYGNITTEEGAKAQLNRLETKTGSDIKRKFRAGDITVGKGSQVDLAPIKVD